MSEPNIYKAQQASTYLMTSIAYHTSIFYDSNVYLNVTYCLLASWMIRNGKTVCMNYLENESFLVSSCRYISVACSHVLGWVTYIYVTTYLLRVCMHICMYAYTCIYIGVCIGVCMHVRTTSMLYAYLQMYLYVCICRIGMLIYY